MPPKPFSILPNEPLHEGIRRVLCERVDAALQQLDGNKPRDPATTVHEVRKRLKELRASLRLIRPALDAETFATENTGLRDIGRPLSNARDAEVMVQALEALKKHFKPELAGDAFASVARVLQRRRKQIVAGEVDAGHALKTAASHLRAVRARIVDWGLSDLHWSAVETGLGRCYRQGRTAMKAALKASQDDSLHEWRKRVKDLRYQLTLLQPVWPALMKTITDEAHSLGSDLGDDHDLAVLFHLLQHDLHDSVLKPDRQALQALITRRRKTLQDHATCTGHRLYAEKPKAFISRMTTYWHTIS